MTGYYKHHEKWKKSGFLFLLVLFCSVAFLICYCEASDLSQKNSPGFNESTRPSPTIQKNISLSATDQKTVVYLPKTDYNSGEPIEISGSTTLPTGTHLYIEIHRDWHQKAVPEGKAIGWQEDTIVQNRTDGTDRNFFVSFNSTMLIPGDYYISVWNLDAEPEEEVLLNRTSFHFTIDKSLITTQSGIPLALTALMIMIAVFIVSIWKKRN